jgi:uncharacterized SAM-binding protein YcdF (DUF218 family)
MALPRQPQPDRAARRHRRLAWLALPLLVGLAWLAGLIGFVAAIPTAADAPSRRTDAIVVLTGGSERLAEGLRLLTAGLGRKLLVSGVGRDVELAQLLQSLPSDEPRPDPALGACCIALDHGAGNTLGNAVETALWMRSEGFRSLRLVTADYHMPRSLLEFRRAMPDVEILRHPVFPRQVMREQWWRWPGTTGLMIGEYHKFLLALLRGPLGWLLPAGPASA